MKKKFVKVLIKKTTCNVLIRDFPIELAERIKSETSNKTLSKALIGVAQYGLLMKDKHLKLIQDYDKLRERERLLNNNLRTFFYYQDNLRSLVFDKKELSEEGIIEKDEDDQDIN